MAELLTLLGPYLPYIIGFLAKVVCDRLGIKIPLLPAPVQPHPDAPKAPSSLLDLLKLILRWRENPASLTPKEKDDIKLAWHALPEKEPE